MKHETHSARAFTLAEILVVIGVIAVLIAFLFPALLRAGRVANKTESLNRMRQIYMWMGAYSGDSNDYILPSQFDYTDSAVFPYPGKVRTVPSDQAGKTLSVGVAHAGTWADIIWTENNLAGGLSNLATAEETLGFSYRFSAPDLAAYKELDNDIANPLRSKGLNTRNYEHSNADGIFKPYGDGAREKGYAGLFAANDFFNARPDAPPIPGSAGTPAFGNWFTNAQIRVPDRSMYLVDSYAGVTIAPQPGPYDIPNSGAEGATVVTDAASRTDEVDFRYNGTCLMLFLDGHMSDEGPWPDLDYLQTIRRINVTNPLASTP